MTHPTDYELEALAAILEAVADERQGKGRDSMTLEDEAAAMLRACKGGAVKVKPLEWTDYGVACWIAPAPLFGSFRVEHYGNEKWQALWSVPGYCAAFVDGEFATADDAKAAIEIRILSALEPAPDARQEGWRAAIEAAAKVVPTGWCQPETSHIEMDVDLCQGIIAAIRALAEKGPDHE